jgi:hypothetical protein
VFEGLPWLVDSDAVHCQCLRVGLRVGLRVARSGLSPARACPSHAPRRRSEPDSERPRAGRRRPPGLGRALRLAPAKPAVSQASRPRAGPGPGPQLTPACGGGPGPSAWVNLTCLYPSRSYRLTRSQMPCGLEFQFGVSGCPEPCGTATRNHRAAAVRA